MKINSINFPIVSPYFKANPKKANNNSNGFNYCIVAPTSDGFFRMQGADLSDLDIFSDVAKLINHILDEMHLERDIDEYFLMLADAGIQDTLKQCKLTNQKIKNNSANKIVCGKELNVEAIEELLDEAGIETFSDAVRFAKKFYDTKNLKNKADIGWIETLKIHGILDNKDDLLKYGEILAVLYDTLKDSKKSPKDFNIINEYCAFLNKINLKNTDDDFISRFSYLGARFNNFECATDKIDAIDYLYRTYPKKLKLLEQVLLQNNLKYKNIEQTYQMTNDVVDYIFERNKGKSLEGFEKIAPLVLRKKKFSNAGLNKVSSYFNNFQTGKDKTEFYEYLYNHDVSLADFNDFVKIGSKENISIMELIENNNIEPEEDDIIESEAELSAQSVENIENEKEIFENEALKEAYYKIAQSLKEAKKRVPSGHSVNNYFKKYASNEGQVENLVTSVENLPDNLSFKRYLSVLDEIQSAVDEFDINLKIDNDNILNIDVSDFSNLKTSIKKFSILLNSLTKGAKFSNPIAHFEDAFNDDFYHPRYNIAYDLVKNKDSRDCAYNTMLKKLGLEKEDLGLDNNCSDFVYIKALKDYLSQEFVDFINSPDWINCLSQKKNDKKLIPNMSLHAKLRIIARFIFDENYTNTQTIDFSDEKIKNTVSNLLETIYDTTPRTFEKSREGDRIVTTSSYRGKIIETVFNNQGQMVTIFPKY